MSKQCYEQAHMTCAEFGLWVQYRKLSYASHRLFCAGQKTADRFSGVSIDQIYRLRKSLVNKGWLILIKSRGYDKDTGKKTVAEFTVLSHEEWVATHGQKYCKSNLSEHFPEPSAPVQMEEKTISTCANEPSAPVQTDHLHQCLYRAKGNQLEENQRKGLPTAKQTPTDKQTGSPLGRQDAPLAEPTIPPSAPVQMVDLFADLTLEFDEYTRKHVWGAARGRTYTAEDKAEVKRRNDERLTPQQIAAETQEVAQ